MDSAAVRILALLGLADKQDCVIIAKKLGGGGVIYCKYLNVWN